MSKESNAEALVDATIGVAAHLESELEEALAEHRLTRASFLVLSELERAPGHTLNQREVVARVRRTSGTMSVRLGRLEHAGIISRERDPENRRSVTVSLTERGLQLVQAAQPAYRDRAERLLSALSASALQALTEHIPAWLAFFEPDERMTPRLGVAVAPSAVASRMRGAVGLSEQPGVLILRVRADSPANRAELSRGDLVVEVDGEPVRSIGDLDRAVRGARTELKVRVLRGAEPRELTVQFEGVQAE
ncbi:MAG TPA: PDZ domain-containing protein [Gaiellales bacterium]|nr:PDZ domain-containing protein [Gaiellales bacterium]